MEPMGLAGEPEAVTGGAGNPASVENQNFTSPNEGLGSRYEPPPVPRPSTTGICQVCEGSEGHEIISSTGLIHFASNEGMTFCGKDATGDGWWWPL